MRRLRWSDGPRDFVGATPRAGASVSLDNRLYTGPTRIENGILVRAPIPVPVRRSTVPTHIHIHLPAQASQVRRMTDDNSGGSRREHQAQEADPPVAARQVDDRTEPSNGIREIAALQAYLNEFYRTP